MTKKKSILNLRHLVPPQPKVARRQLENGRWQAAIIFPGGVEPMIFDRPTYRGLENEIIHQCRKFTERNIKTCSSGYTAWDSVQEMWGEYNGMV